MKTRETISDFYRQYGKGHPPAEQVTVYRLEDLAKSTEIPHLRRDFYKVKLLDNAQGILAYADQHIAIRTCALIFVNPLVPHSWHRLSGRETGFACLFTEEFVTQQLRLASVAGSPLFRVGGNPMLFPPPEVVGRLHLFFEQLLTEMHSSYPNKYDLMRNYLQLILHESIKLTPVAPFYQPGTSAARLSFLFLELLERQFPVATPHHTLPLRNANEFARQLAVHPNHLNKALKEITGKTTTEHIAEKLVAEAKTLLRNSDWSLAEIGTCLGFEHASNFNSFFKTHTKQPPSQYRRRPGVLS